MSLFLVACLSKQCKVLPTQEDQRLDHATKLEASLPRLFRSHCLSDIALFRDSGSVGGRIVRERGKAIERKRERYRERELPALSLTRSSLQSEALVYVRLSAAPFTPASQFLSVKFNLRFVARQSLLSCMRRRCACVCVCVCVCVCL
jgi:hypothetical protein